jgi:flagellar hook-associated protein 1 FlgK
MAGFLSSLGATANALRVFEKALTVTQNNVANASTPGFAKQTLYLEAVPFAPDLGLPGGVRAARLESARQEYAERAVQVRQSIHSRSEETAAALSRIEGLFDVSGEAGLPGALTALFASITSWSVAPNDTVARQAVLERARDLASRFRETAAALGDASFQTSTQIQNTVSGINSLLGRVRELNVLYRQDIRNLEDPALDARLHDTLEQLAESVDFTALRHEDGSVTILLGGQTPLLVGDQQFEISADTSGDQAVILDANGRDISSQISQGRLAAQLAFRNQTVPGLLSELNRLAAAIADRVNAILEAGLDREGQPGAALFAYDAPELAAATLRVTAIEPGQLAAATASAPGGNGNVLALMELAESPELDGFSFIGFYGTLARRVGTLLEDARQDSAQHEQMLLQARWLREQASSVSLDEEAVRLIQFQRSYEAAAKMIRAIDELLETVLGLLR